MIRASKNINESSETRPYKMERQKYVELPTKMDVPYSKPEWPIGRKVSTVKLQLDNILPYTVFDDSSIVAAGSLKRWSVFTTLPAPYSVDFHVSALS